MSGFDLATTRPRAIASTDEGDKSGFTNWTLRKLVLLTTRTTCAGCGTYHHSQGGKLKYKLWNYRTKTVDYMNEEDVVHRYALYYKVSNEEALDKHVPIVSMGVEYYEQEVDMCTECAHEHITAADKTANESRMPMMPAPPQPDKRTGNVYADAQREIAITKERQAKRNKSRSITPPKPKKKPAPQTLNELMKGLA